MRPHLVRSAPSLAQQLEEWTKVVVGAVGLLYVLGFLVHTIYLSAYGITAVNLLRVQYILAGVWALMPIALTLACAAIVRYNVAVEQNAENAKARAAFGALAVFLFLILILIIRLGPVFVMPARITGEEIMWTFAALFIAGAVTYLAWTVKESAVRMWGNAVVAILVFAIYLTLFAHAVYPGIVSSLGGGRPANVRFVLATASPRFLAVDTNEVTQRSYPLLTATDRNFIILDGDHAVEVTRDLVKAIIYETPKR